VGVPQPRSALFMPVSLALLIHAATSRAAEPGYLISVGVIETDNVQRVSSGGSNDTIFEQEASFNWHEQRPLFNADIEADLSHLTYVPRTFSDEVIGNFIGSGRLAIVPQYFFWNISDNFGQGITDATQAVTPQNRENINFYSTGPQALLPLSAVEILDLNGTYGRASYQNSPLNSQRFGGGAGYIHLLSATAEVSVNVHQERLEYSNNTLNPGYNLQEAFAHFDIKGRRTTLAIDGGYDRVTGLGGLSSGGALARIQLSRKVSGSSTLSFSVGRQYSDSVGAFQMSQVLGGANLNTQQGVQVGGPFNMTFVTGGWNFSRNRTQFGIDVSHFRDSYVENRISDDNRTEVNLHISRQLTPTMRLALSEFLDRLVFENEPGTSTNTTTDARLSWQMSRRISMTFAYDYSRRTSDAPGSAYTQNTVWVSIGYGREAQVPVGPVAPPLPLPMAVSQTR
jgi:hypothetical protein